MERSDKNEGWHALIYVIKGYNYKLESAKIKKETMRF